jgi:hypothetical protein
MYPIKGDLLALKRTSSIAVCILLLCSSLLIISVGTVMALNSEYSFDEYWAGAAIIDGKWTTPEEWQIGMPHYIGTVQKGMFIMQANSESGGYWPEYVIEFADNTQDAGDIIRVCMTAGGEESSPAAGTTVKVEIQGLTTKKVYDGTGSGWTDSAYASAVTTAATVTTSAHDPANHVVAEVSIQKENWGMAAPPLGVFIGCYDASTDTWVTWPPAASADNPSTWGVIAGYQMEPYPEGLTIGVMLLVSSIAAVVSIRYFRKPPKL